MIFPDGVEKDLGFAKEMKMCKHQTIRLDGPMPPTGHTYNYSWLLDGTQITNNFYYVLNNIDIGTHTVELQVGNGCTDQITLISEICPLEIPNIITPNGDNYNDRFVIKGLEYYPGSTIVIYNRWGKKVFETNSYHGEWDAADDPDGVFYYILILNDGQKTAYSGSITVMRGR